MVSKVGGGEAEGEDDGGGRMWGDTFDYNEKKIKLSGFRPSAEKPTNPIVATCKRCHHHPLLFPVPPLPSSRGGGELEVE